ncbi:hypothetical protein H5410_061687 [Solanum commersonii]|uniref:Uncharacterized protein n=1 Tax=Solanum commersonii TaxID=4109 RepID=A0A9J5W8P5_SOLCO|nr:hypothetical protein H5410_061687 [Solanum commersonii]
MAGTVGESINLDPEYFCQHCDSRTDVVSDVVKLLSICYSVASRADIEMILNFSLWYVADSSCFHIYLSESL